MEDKDIWELKFKPCIYSEKLISKISDLNETCKNKVDIREVTKAIYYAKKYHAGQKRQSGEDYYSHPIEVAFMVSDYLFKTDILITSILHDTIEDTKLSFEMIVDVFGENIAINVNDLTRIKPDRKISSQELVERLWIERKYDILFVKLFDRLHNLMTINAKSAEKINKIVKETINSFIVLAAYLNVRDIEEKITKLCAECINLGILENHYSIPFGVDDKDLLSLIVQNDLFHK